MEGGAKYADHSWWSSYYWGCNFIPIQSLLKCIIKIKQLLTKVSDCFILINNGGQNDIYK